MFLLKYRETTKPLLRRWLALYQLFIDLTIDTLSKTIFFKQALLLIIQEFRIIQGLQEKRIKRISTLVFIPSAPI